MQLTVMDPQRRTCKSFQTDGPIISARNITSYTVSHLQKHPFLPLIIHRNIHRERQSAALVVVSRRDFLCSQFRILPQLASQANET